jgi:hypothetical protein
LKQRLSKIRAFLKMIGNVSAGKRLYAPLDAVSRLSGRERQGCVKHRCRAVISPEIMQSAEII